MDQYGNKVDIDPTWDVVNGGGFFEDGFFVADGAPGIYSQTIVAKYDGAIGYATVAITSDESHTGGDFDITNAGGVVKILGDKSSKIFDFETHPKSLRVPKNKSLKIEGFAL